MTPKEKAEELMCTFAKIIPPSSYVAYEEGVQINFDLENAKQCTLITINELIEHLQPASDFGGEINKYTIEYWEEIKKEIKNL